MKRKNDDLSRKKSLDDDQEVIKHASSITFIPPSAKKIKFFGLDDCFTIRPEYLYGLSKEKSKENKKTKLNELLEQKKASQPLSPIVIEVKKEIIGHEYILPIHPMSTYHMQRCTTAFESYYYGIFNNIRYREYKKLRDIFDTHTLHKYKYVLDPIFYYNDDTLKKEIDQSYRDFILLLRKRKKQTND
ncbi:hypothetical protein NGRA_1726 [Nosema granulosis]|uniref:Uncharacterized protein n=1 Tax=Nosema granulosis TaxID=83296 RepID=A0A9P6H188_9MICR|nr:hypothetical protein NGRA_1726 [Nosema granulosis]